MATPFRQPWKSPSTAASAVVAMSGKRVGRHERAQE